MEETKVSKREWVKTAAIIFLAILLVLTFFSNTIMNATLPEVAAQQIEGGTINAKIRGSGTVGANETYDVTINQTRKIASVLVKVGQSVNAGDTLFLLESQESDEVKAAQDELDQLELSYEKSLIDAGNNSAKENHEVQKARDAYNEALAIYHQYSTMDATRLASEQAKADAAQKAAQANYDSLQEQYTTASSDKTYTDAQAAVTEQTANVKSLKASIDEYTQKLRELQTGAPTKTVDQVQSEIDAANTELTKLLKDNATALAMHEANYKRLSALAGGRNEVMAAYCTMTDEELAKALGSYTGGETGNDGTVITPATVNTDDARAVKAAYAALKDYYAAKSAQEERLTTLQAELEVAQKYTTTAQTIQQYQSKLNTATYDLNTAQNTLNNAQNIVNQYDNNLKALKASVDQAKSTLTAAQEAATKLQNASTAAETVKSTKSALEELLFTQQLGDSSYLDMQAAKENIEKKKEALAKLTANADELEVKAKVGGVIASIEVTAGNSIGPDTPLAKLNVADRGYTIKISVTAEQAKRVKVGDKADVVNYWGGNVEAVLENIARDPNTSGNNLLVFKLTGDVDPNTNLTLSIGQKSASYDALVPNSAVRTDNNGTFVLALTSKSTPLSTRYTATRVPVQVLAQDDTMSAVSGIGAGEFVITTSTKPIEAGTQVKLADNG
ncbi:MAG: hypothetical protein DBX57_05370 [Clostridia bacterium]|nr:MAG: hypothetical protein DBX57_05370 [Clostridia bacterium]